jgi:SHS2 domain-containing protein
MTVRKKRKPMAKKKTHSSGRKIATSKKKMAKKMKSKIIMSVKRTKKISPILPSFRYLEHTGDIMIESHGSTFATALVQAAMAMFKVMGPAEPMIYFEVDEQALNRDELVVYFLSRVLSEVEAREMVPCKVEVLTCQMGPTWQMKANIWGENRRPRDAIKAVTFHELKVEENLKTGWRIQVLLDV